MNDCNGGATERRWQVLRLAVSAMCCVAVFDGAAATPVTDLKKALVGYFKELDRPLIPVLVPRGQAVGSIYNLKSLETIADREDCFPSLQVPKPTPTNFPGSITVTGASGSLYLFMQSLFKVGLSGEQEKNTIITFREPTVQLVTAAALRGAWDEKKCPDLVPFLKTGPIAKADAPQPQLLIVGEVYSAKIDVVVSTHSAASAKALLDEAVARIGSSGIQAEIKDGVTVVLHSDERLPVAVAPALIPVAESGIFLGGDGQKTVPADEFEWQAYEPDKRPSLAKYLREALNDIAAEEAAPK